MQLRSRKIVSRRGAGAIEQAEEDAASEESEASLSSSQSDEGLSLDSGSDSPRLELRPVRKKAKSRVPASTTKRNKDDEPQKDWTEFERRLQAWSALNERYSQKCDAYLANDFEKRCDRPVVFLEFDLRILNPVEMFRTMFRQIFKQSVKDIPLAEMGDTLASLAAESGDRPECPRFVVTVYQWLRLLNDPTIFAYVQEMLSPVGSPFLFVLKSDLVRRVTFHYYRAKAEEAASDNWETIFLFPSNFCAASPMATAHLVWYAPLLADLLLSPPDFLESSPSPVCESSTHSPPESPSPTNFLKSKTQLVETLMPNTCRAFLFCQELNQIRHLRTTARTLSAPIRALEDLKNVAYRDASSRPKKAGQ